MNGNKLKKLRENKQLLQKDLGEILGVSASTIGMYEQGRREPDNTILKKISKYFKVSIDYLLDNETLNNSKQKETLKKALIKNGYMKKDEDLSDGELKKLIEFVKTNKKFIKDVKP